MFSSKIKKRYRRRDGKRICQGDIFKDIELVLDAKIIIKGKAAKVTKKIRKITYAVVMTQDCDLESDNRERNDPSVTNQDKYLQTILVCPAYEEEKFVRGTHI